MSQPLTDTALDVLLSSTRVGHSEIRNRIALAPMTRVSADHVGNATDTMARYYEVFAEGGFGLLITEGIYTDSKHSQGYLNQPGLATTEHADSWRRLTERVHGHGATIFAQLMHAGAQSQGNRFTDAALAPSAVSARGQQLAMYRGSGPYRSPRPASVEDIAHVRSGFVAAARRAVDAGFDGVELHGANGYLLDEFLTDYMNQRSDEYGGSTVNRVRLVREVISDVLDAVGSQITVGVRISQAKVADTLHKWAGGDSDAEIIFSEIGSTGVHFIHTSEFDASAPAFDGSSWSLAQLATRHGKVPVIANGSLDDPADAAELLDSGAADIVALGKSALANRDWPRRVRSGSALTRALDPNPLGPLADIKEFELG
ncbi:NADH:flavin oxidoreductase [Rhodococcus sp. 06-621-2]|nr:NADH:flavin oxidoreductase [Rhodococcus sp. 06-621-2]OZC55467.1 NADH:flavin oxidoreductase [Rhodococcus sp. 06-621-2]